MPQCSDKQCLTEPRDTLDQDVSIGKQGDQCPQYELFLANKDLGNFVGNLIE